MHAKTRRIAGHLVRLFTCLLACLQALFAAAPNAISGPAYALLNTRAGAPRSSFYIYQDADSGFNHGVPSGIFGAVSSVHLNAACIDDPTPANTSGCSSNAQALDRQRGTVFQVIFDPLGLNQFAGVNFEEPQNFSNRPGSAGYDLRGATRMLFDVRSPSNGGVRLQFGIAGQTGDFVTIPQSSSWSSMSISLAGIDLSNPNILFTIVTNSSAGGVLPIDNIRLDPVPAIQTSAVGLPVTYQTFGLIPTQSAITARVPIAPDQLLRNLSAVYDASLTLIALSRRGTSGDLSGVAAIANSLDYLLGHDNNGDPIPAAADGSRGFHNGYEAGESRLLNDEVPAGRGLKGQARFAGFSGGTGLCGAGGYCLVLDGGTSGNNATAIQCLLAAWRRLHTTAYLDDARVVGKWILSLADNQTGFGGYFNGYDDSSPVPKQVNQGKSTESNALIFSAFTALAAAEQTAGNSPASASWTTAAQTAGDFVIAMFDKTAGKFNAGSVPASIKPGPGISPTGPARGNDVTNVFDFIDANSLPVITMAASPSYQNTIDWRLPVRWILNNYPQTVQAGGQTFQGFNLIVKPASGPNGIGWEFTGQAVIAMRLVDRIYGTSEFESAADNYLAQIAANQQSAPFGDGAGLTAGTLQNGDTLPPQESCISTPFQCIPDRVSLAATVLAIFAESASSSFRSSCGHFIRRRRECGVFRSGTRQCYIEWSDRGDFRLQFRGYFRSSEFHWRRPAHRIAGYRRADQLHLCAVVLRVSRSDQRTGSRSGFVDRYDPSDRESRYHGFRLLDGQPIRVRADACRRLFARPAGLRSDCCWPTRTGWLTHLVERARAPW